MATTATRICSKCNAEKPLNAFAKNNKCPSGYGYRCKICHNIRKRTNKLSHPNYRELSRIKMQKWRESNPEKAQASNRRSSLKYLSTAKGRLSKNIRRRIGKDIGKNKQGLHWEILVDFTYQQLEKHLEKQFMPDMTWENYGKKWHIDHKIPISVHNFTSYSDLDFKKCWSLNNLRPLYVFDNKSKGNRINEPFQPSLAL